MRTAVALTVALCGLVAVAMAAAPREPRSNSPSRGYEKPCPACDKRREPVCATSSSGDKKTFFNDCLVGYFNCEDGTDYEKTADGECAEDPLQYAYDENEAFDPVEVAME